MLSFHQSRGRIFFEVVCALAVSASLAGAWLQTGASAFLPAAFAVGLYGLWHLTDMAGRRPAMALDAAPAGDGQGDLLDYIDTAVSQPEALVEPAAGAIERPEAVAEPEAPPAKPARKPSTRRTKARKEVEVAAPAPPETQDGETLEEAAHPHIAPLFEPEPFVRMPRQAFGRRGRI